VAITATRTNICKNEKTLLTAGGAATYTWSTFSQSAAITVSPSSQTIYSVTGTDAVNCSNTATVLVKVSACTGIQENSESILQIFPNPARGSFYISALQPCKVEIINSAGQLVRTFSFTSSEAAVNVSGLEPGLYFVLMNGEKQPVVVQAPE
jgi:hypothetical protein